MDQHSHDSAHHNFGREIASSSDDFTAILLPGFPFLPFPFLFLWILQHLLELLWAKEHRGMSALTSYLPASPRLPVNIPK